MAGWRRAMWFDATGLPWVPLSPGMPHLVTATVYPGMCFIEGTNLSEGRGTTSPFEVVGAPWLDGRALAQALNRLALPGARFRPTHFVPSASKHAGLTCQGVQVHVGHGVVEVKGPKGALLQPVPAPISVAAAAMTVFLLSLAGIPSTAGFVGKWWLFGSAIKADSAWLAVLAVLHSAISLYYYVRIVAAMYVGDPEEEPPAPAPAALRAALAISFVFTIWIGIYPQPFIRFAQYALWPTGN